jgi:hypothetical protein
MFLSIALNMTSYTTQGSETRKLTIEGGIVLKKTFRLAICSIASPLRFVLGTGDISLAFQLPAWGRQRRLEQLLRNNEPRRSERNQPVIVLFMPKRLV